MAAFGSIATASELNGGGVDTLDVTKPSGLAAGDMMVALIAVRSNSAPTSTGFTSLTNAGDGNRQLHILFKVATSGDASASTFTFSYSASAGAPIGIALIRVTGTFTGSDNFLYSTDDNAAATSQTFTPGITPPTTSSLLVMGAYGTEASISQSGYAITNNNPTWTEQADFNQAATGDDVSLSVATATASAASATGDFSITFSSSTEGIGYLLAITDSASITATPTVISAVASVQAPSVSGGANVSTTVVSSTVSVQAPTISTPAPTWTNPDKTAAPTFTNPDKT